MTAWLVETFVSSTLLLLAVLAVRRPAAKAFGARVAYALWLLPALRMVLPPLPGHRAWFVPVLDIAPAGPVHVGLAPPAAMFDPLVGAPAFDLPPLGPQWSWVAILVALWLAGAALWLGWQLLRYRIFLTRALDGATLLGRECGVAVLLSDHVGGPVAAGIVHRRILLPRDFTTRYDAAERRQALLHEGAHHDRHDLLANLVALGMVALHWWNPLAHLAHRAFRADQELACDATVLARADAGERYAYGRALVKSFGRGMPAAACALDNATEVKRRLRAIGRGGIAGPLRAIGALLAAGAIAGGLVATASSGSPVRAAAVAPLPIALPEPPAPPAEPMVTPNDIGREVARAERERARARRAGEHAQRAALHAASEAHRAADRVRAELIAANVAQLHGQVMASVDRDRMARASMEPARAKMVADCATRGRPVAPDERDWGELALCGRAAFHADLRRSIAQARASAEVATELR